ANYGGGYMFAEGQLVIGGGARTAVLQITDRTSQNTLVDVGGTSPEIGGVLQLAGQPFRIGLAARMPVQSGRISEVRAAGKTLPRQIRLPWELQAGVAFQLGDRPLNRKWINPHDVDERLRNEMLARRSARSREQLRRETLARQLALADASAPPQVAALQGNA